MTQVQASRRSEQGFTLVELAIVMVIIGLLIGGILKGQELIANARISSTVSQIKGLDAAMNTFNDKYNSLPGDIATPGARLPNCTAAPCNVVATGGGLGNGHIEGGNIANVPGVGEESGIMFVHLNAADLISGINPANGATFGGQFPAARAGGGLYTAFTTAAIANTGLPAGKHYTVLSGVSTGSPAAGNGPVNATTAAQIDRKMDDGIPQNGSVQTIGANCVNGAGATSTYAENTDGGTCTVYARALN